MKSISITIIVVIMVLFGGPLLSIKDNYTSMEYEEIGNDMLSNVEPTISMLETTSNLAEKSWNIIDTALEGISTAIKTIQDWVGAIMDFVKGIFETESNQVCTENPNGGFTCGSSDGGGGGSFGGR